METRLAHPVFAPYREWLARLPDPLAATVAELNALAEGSRVRVESGAPLQFVLPSAGSKKYEYGGYERQIYESGCVETRPGSLHDLFNALAWLAFPRTKARLNALHAREIPREQGRRGRFRDLLTLIDEGGAIIRCNDRRLRRLVVEMRWKELFWEERNHLADFEVIVVGHAVLERALAPWPGIVCKGIFVDERGEADNLAARALAHLPPDATPRALPVLPVFGYPGWHPATAQPSFYDDERYFRRSRPTPPDAGLRG